MADRTFVFEASPTAKPLFTEPQYGAVQRQRSRSEGDTEAFAPGLVPNHLSLLSTFAGEERGRNHSEVATPVTPFVSRSWDAILASDRDNQSSLKKVTRGSGPRGLRRRSRSLGDQNEVNFVDKWTSLLEGGASSAKKPPRGRSLSEADSPVLRRNQTFPSFFGREDGSGSRGRRHSTGDWRKASAESRKQDLNRGFEALGAVPRTARLTSLKLAALEEVRIVRRSEWKEGRDEEKGQRTARAILAKAGSYLKDAGTVTVTAGVWSCGDHLLQHLAFHGTGRSLKQQLQLLLAGKVGGRVSIQTRVPLAVGRDMVANALSIATYDLLSSSGAPQLVASTAGTFAASAVTVPAWHLSYLLKTGAASTPRQAWELFIESQGVEGLFSGLVPTVVRSIPTSFVMSGTHTALKRLLAKAKKSDQTNLLDVFLLGAAAGLASSVTSLSVDAVSKSVPTLLLKRAPASVVTLALARAGQQVAAQTFSKGMLVGIGTTGLSYVVDECTGKLLQKLEERARKGRISTDLRSLAIQRALEQSAASWQHQQRADGQDGPHGHSEVRTSFQLPEVDVGAHHMHKELAELSLGRSIMVAA